MTSSHTTTSARLDLSTYLVADPRISGPNRILNVIRAAVAGGIPVVQIRDKTAPTRELYELVMCVSDITAQRSTLIVDDRVDVFLAARLAGAAVNGVHLGQSDLPITATRQLIGPDAVLGLSANTMTHLEEIALFPSGMVDYLGVGTIRPTLTKPDHPPPLGIQGFAQFAAATSVPCVAIGGIRFADLEALRSAGAAGVAVVSAICAADNPEIAVREFRAAWKEAEA
jgi:thiamine-phosphate pyrophosphorylase